jgi:hypothetical protein
VLPSLESCQLQHKGGQQNATDGFSLSWTLASWRRGRLPSLVVGVVGPGASRDMDQSCNCLCLPGRGESSGSLLGAGLLRTLGESRSNWTCVGDCSL